MYSEEVATSSTDFIQEQITPHLHESKLQGELGSPMLSFKVSGYYGSVLVYLILAPRGTNIVTTLCLRSCWY